MNPAPSPSTPQPPLALEVVPPAPETRVTKWARNRLAAAPLKVNGTWESVRRWKDGAERAGRVMVFCQVMAGFELMALRDAHPETRGRPASGIARIESFDALCRREAGISIDRARIWIQMAEGSIPRLKKLANLKGWDPRTVPLDAMPEAQREDLEKAVHKITDGITQTDFLQQLGLAKMPQGSGVVGGYKGPRKSAEMTTEEKAELAAQEARLRFGAANHELSWHPTGWMLLGDDEIAAQVAILELHLAPRREWLKRPKNRRDPVEFDRMYKRG